jgi:hypothetical protein
MAFLDWIKGPEHAYQANHGKKTIWKGTPYSDKASGYLVQPCLGLSEKGYHAGLTFTHKDGEGKTTWHRPLQRRDQAMQECYSSFNEWVQNHQSHLNEKPRGNVRRMSPSWERSWPKLS